MNIGVISMRYAKAMLAFALENGEENAIYNMMLQLRHTFRNVKQLPVVLQNPSLSQNERVGLICDAVNASPLFERFARLVVKEEREELLLFIAHAYIMLYRREKKILSVDFTTAVPADDALNGKITAMLAGDHDSVELNNAVDPSIIGGFIIEADSKRYDASVGSQLREIRKQLVKQNRKLV